MKINIQTTLVVAHGMHRMKPILLLILLFIGCKAKVEKPSEWEIEMKKSDILLRYRVDSIEAASEYRIELIHTTSLPEALRERTVRAHMLDFHKRWSTPYSLMRDTSFKMQTYLDYCKNFGHDPKTYINFMK